VLGTLQHSALARLSNDTPAHPATDMSSLQHLCWLIKLIVVFYAAVNGMGAGEFPDSWHGRDCSGVHQEVTYGEWSSAEGD
jgi:hypothetical protein